MDDGGIDVSAIKKCEQEVQSIVDEITRETKLTIERGFEKMQKNPNFEKMILDVKEKFEREDPKYFVVKQGPVSILGLNSKDYGLPVSFDNFLDFMAFTYGLANMFSINVLGVNYTYDGHDCMEECTEEFSTIDDFLRWIKNQFVCQVDIDDGYKRSIECASYVKFDGPIKYSSGYAHSPLGWRTINKKETKYYGGLISAARGRIYLYAPVFWNLTITFYRVPPIKNDTKAISWY